MAAVNVLFAALFAAGILAVVFGLAQRRRVSLAELENITGTAEISRGPIESLRHQIEDARLNVGVDQFLTMSVILAFVGAGAAYLLSGAFLAGILGFVVGGISYWVYLTSRASAALEAYENALPDVLARLRAGAQLGGTLEAAAGQVAEYGPPICRDDWRYIASQLRAGVPVQVAFDTIAARRGSLLLNTIFELVDIQTRRGVSLVKSLEGVQEALEERVRVMKRARTSMQGPVRELALVCAIPFLVVIILRVVAPGYADIFGTFAGQIILLVGWGVDILAFILGYLSFTHGLKEETNFGGVAMERRSEDSLKLADESPSNLVAEQPNVPQALRGVLGEE
jgi:tight adherence protein B